MAACENKYCLVNGVCQMRGWRMLAEMKRGVATRDQWLF